MQAGAPPRIFDRDLVRWRLARARSKNPATFLLDRAAEDLTERLGAVLRPFPRVLDLGTPTPQLAAALAAQSSERVITRLAPLPEPASPLWRDRDRATRRRCPSRPKASTSSSRRWRCNRSTTCRER